MPSSVTHTYFSNCVYDELPKKIKVKLNNSLNYYNFFSEGADPFMFYGFFIGNKAKRGKSIQYKMHTLKTRDFFIDTIYYIHNNNLEKNSEVLSFLYGYICHYYLDLTMHPFINYQAGCFRKEDKNTYYANTLHQKIEYRIDSYFIKYYLKENPLKFKCYEYIFNITNFSKELEILIDKILKKNYNIDNASKVYQVSARDMKKFFRIINYDPIGYKRIIYLIIDKITPKWVVRLEELSYHTKEDGSNYLNLSHDKWCYPWDNKNYFNTSFFDLWEVAKEKTVKTIIELDDMLDSKEIDNKRLHELFLDLSYATGILCDKKVKYMYFKEDRK